MVTFFLSAILTAAITTLLYYRTPKPRAQQAALLVAAFTVAIVVALLVLSISHNQHDFYYSETIRGPFHARFLWLHRSFLLEVLGGLVVGYFIGHWIYMLSVRLRQPEREKVFRRQDIVTVALVGFVMLAVHPEQLVSNVFSRITYLSTPIGSLELDSPSETMPRATSTFTNQRELYPPHPIEWTALDLRYLANAVYIEDIYPQLLTPSTLTVTHDQETMKRYKAETLERKASLRLFTEHLIPLIQCEAFNVNAGVHSTPPLDFARLRNFLLASLIDEKPSTLGNNLDTHNVIVDIHRELSFVEIYRDLLTDTLKRAHSLFEDPMLRVDSAHRCNTLLRNVFPDEWRHFDTLDSRIPRAAAKFVGDNRKNLRDSLDNIFEQNTEDNASSSSGSWGAILVSTLSSVSGNPLLGLNPLEYWLNEKSGHESEAYFRVHVLDLYRTQYRRLEAVNLFSEITLYENLISAYKKLLFDEVRSDVRVLDEERYCDFNPLAKQYFLRYLNELNNYAYRISQGENRLDIDFRVAGIRGFEYVETAREYMDVIEEITLECLITEEKPLLQSRVMYLDTEAALTMAEFRLSELSSRAMRDDWRVRLRKLRERMQGPYSLFVELVRTESQIRSRGESALTRARESDNSQNLELLEGHLQQLGEYIEMLK